MCRTGVVRTYRTASGLNVGTIANFTPVVQGCGLIATVDTNACTTAELEVYAVPSVGDPASCTLHYPAPVLGQFSGCSSSTADPTFLEPGTTVKLTATFVGAGRGGAAFKQFSCTTAAPAAPKGDYGQIYVAPLSGSRLNWNVGSVRCPI